MDLNTLLNILHSPEYILHRFARQMEVQLNMLTGKGVEGLLDLFDNVGRLMKPTLDHSLSLPALNKNSVLGLYIRRVIIFFEKLPFDQVVALYEALKKYLDKRINTFDGSDISTDSKTENLFHSNEYVFMNCNLLLDIYFTISLYVNRIKTTWGGRQAELLVAQQAHTIQTDEHKAMPPAELQSLVRELLSCSPYYAEAVSIIYPLFIF